MDLGSSEVVPVGLSMRKQLSNKIAASLWRGCPETGSIASRAILVSFVGYRRNRARESIFCNVTDSGSLPARAHTVRMNDIWF